MKQAEKVYPLNMCVTENSGSVRVMFAARRFVLNAERYSEIQAGVLSDMHLLVCVQRIPSSSLRLSWRWVTVGDTEEIRVGRSYMTKARFCCNVGIHLPGYTVSAKGTQYLNLLANCSLHMMRDISGCGIMFFFWGWAVCPLFNF